MVIAATAQIEKQRWILKKKGKCFIIAQLFFHLNVQSTYRKRTSETHQNCQTRNETKMNHLFINFYLTFNFYGTPTRTRRNSKYKKSSLFSDDDLSDESDRTSVASSCLETELEFEHMQDKNFNQDRTLYLQACECLGVVPIKRLLHQLCSDEIQITHRNLNDTDCKAISNALVVNKTVTVLDLSNNLITDKGVLYLASAMVEQNLVRVLVLAGNKLAYSSAEIFAELLQRCSNLTVLDLSSNNIDNKACVILAQAIKNNKTLQEFHLNHNKLCDNAGLAIADALTYNTVLERFSLSWNIIRHGVVPIATALSTNQTLRYLDLSWNGIDDVGVRALVGGLETNIALEEINLSRNNITDSGFLEMVKVLEKCRLQKLDISRNNCLGSNGALEMLLRLLLDEKTELQTVNTGNTLIL